MADYSTVRDAILVCRQAQVSLFVWGSHGIGKSSVVRQAAQTLEIGFVDFRCAQLESSDLRGLPDRGEDKRTHYLPPAELPDSGSGILFLDEFNRASPDVLNAAFQLVLDRRIGSYRLPDGWSIVCAGNLTNGAYQVSELDPALLDRFCHIQLSSGPGTMDDWGMWMLENYPIVAEDIVSFCEQDAKNLESQDKQETGLKITPSRRSWEMVARCLAVLNTGVFSEKVTREVLTGLVGHEIALNFLRGRKLPLTASQFLKSSFDASQPVLKSMSRSQHSQFSSNLVHYLSGKTVTRPIADKALDYLNMLMQDQRDLAIGFAKRLVSCGIPQKLKPPHQMEMALLSDPDFVRLITQAGTTSHTSMTMLDYLSQRSELSRKIAKALSLDPNSNTESAA